MSCVSGVRKKKKKCLNNCNLKWKKSHVRQRNVWILLKYDGCRVHRPVCVLSLMYFGGGFFFSFNFSNSRATACSGRVRGGAGEPRRRDVRLKIDNNLWPTTPRLGVADVFEPTKLIWPNLLCAQWINSFTTRTVQIKRQLRFQRIVRPTMHLESSRTSRDESGCGARIRCTSNRDCDRSNDRRFFVPSCAGGWMFDFKSHEEIRVGRSIWRRTPTRMTLKRVRWTQ